MELITRTQPPRVSTDSTQAKTNRLRRLLTCNSNSKFNSSKRRGSRELTLPRMPTLATTMGPTRVELLARARRPSQSSRTTSRRVPRQKECTFSSILKEEVWPLTEESSLQLRSSTSRNLQRTKLHLSFNQSCNRVTSWC